MTFTLLGYGPGDGLEDISPFCLKVVNYLRWTNTDYELEITDPRRTPRGKLPCLIYGEEVVPDSSGIIHYLETRHAIRLDDHLSARSMLKDALSRVCSKNTSTLFLSTGDGPTKLAGAITKPTFCVTSMTSGSQASSRKREPGAPEKSVQQNIWGQGVGRMDREAVHGKGVEILQSLSTLLDDRAFFVGNEPNSYDACAYAFLASIIRPHIPSPLQTSVRHFDNLVGYCERMRKL